MEFPIDKHRATAVAVDNPITELEEDTLGRGKLASSFAEQILALDYSKGLVVGVLGPWGSGKTSFVNLSRLSLKKSGVTIIEFNPWMFSGTEQLVLSFFAELSAQLKLSSNHAQIGRTVEDYANALSGLAWLPIVGPWANRVRTTLSLIAKILQHKKVSIKSNRDKICQELNKINEPILVILDDIDRLSTQEIRDIFKLVRLTANFPNVIYLLAFDRYRVEQALCEQGIVGRDYLEKILQVAIDLPATPDHLLYDQILKKIEIALSDIQNAGHFDANLWPDVFIEVIYPLIRNVRDVRRYAAAIHCTVKDIGREVALVDVLALEAVRVFLPDVFYNLHSAIDGLTTTESRYRHDDEPIELKNQIDKLVESAGEQAEIARNMIRRLFSGAERHIGGMNYGSYSVHEWLRERRVAHKEILSYYLERVASGGLQDFSDAENAWPKITNQASFDAYLKSLPVERLPDVISKLEVYEDDFSEQHVISGAIVLLNLLPQIPDRRRGIYDFGTRVIVGRVVYRLVRALKDPEVIEAKVKEILPHVRSLYSKQELITRIGYRKNVGHKLVSEQAAKSFEEDWLNQVRSASTEKLAGETNLLRTMVVANRLIDPDFKEPKIIVPDFAEVTLAMLRSARNEIQSQSMSSRATSTEPTLDWDLLVKIYGDESILRDRIEQLKASSPSGVSDLLKLVDKYLSGWRPKNFD